MAAGQDGMVAGALEPVRGARLPLLLRDAGGTALALAGSCAGMVLVGLFGQFSNRWLVVDLLSIGHALMLAAAIVAGLAIAGRYPPEGGLPEGEWPERGWPGRGWMAAALAGVAAGVLLMLLVIGAREANLRWMLVSLTPVTLRRVGLMLPDAQAFLLLAAAGGLAATLGALLRWAPVLPRRVVLGALIGVAVAGLLRELIRGVLAGIGGAEQWAFSYDGLLPAGAVAAAVTGALIGARPGAARIAALPGVARLALRLLCLALLLALPALTNDFVAQVMLLVCLYTLMGLGLNIELGLAGLVDLGFVAFFAVGAYTVALLSASHDGAAPWLGFFAALPFAVGFAACFGFLFGLPVLKVRGDYLAIATLGLGEIIRVLVLSDMLKPWLGGAQGIVNIPKPVLFGSVLSSPTQLFYLTACFTALAGYCAWRLQHSGLGRRWLAVREDEDVAQALGINLVQVKLSAYTMGAGFAGLAGGIFAAMVGSVFPQSFQLLVSINVLAILVVGGIGSLPGVAIGAAALIGAPEVLRDLGEYRYLIYGLAIIAIVRLKPEGLSPSAIRHREAR
ncbi:branched-chain amino acid ABC transporter permease [Roseomonas gilardii]|uniref:branched-chain amino acid ABC transporter permease n=1 Tax=Roseomonas gilardii TaxID=257708 RepID=UPI0011A3DB41|nr:branched-chain amino acid ABC transporter permease [Roseomonas gilardii]